MKKETRQQPPLRWKPKKHRGWGVVFQLIPCHRCMKVLSPMLILPSGFFLLIPEPGHGSDTRFTMGAYIGTNLQEPPQSPMHTFTSFWLAHGLWCPVSPTPQVSGEFPLGLLLRLSNNDINLHNRRVRSGTWVISQTAMGEWRLHSPKVGALCEWLIGCGFGTALPGREHDGGVWRAVRELPLTPAQAVSSKGHL